MDSVAYSVVVPVFNSEHSLQELCERTINTLSSFPFEIIFVDDGSTDNSWKIIRQLKNEHPAIIRAIQLQKNYGQHAATLCAFGICKGEFIITIDDDLQYAPEDILLLIQKQKENDADVIYGIANRKKHAPIRKLGGNLIRLSSKYVEGNKVEKSSFRLLSKKIVQVIATNHVSSSIALDNILKWYTTSFTSVHVAHYPRLFGHSGYSILKLIKVTYTAIINYSILPLKIITYTGFIFSVIFLLIGVYFVIKKLFFEVPVGYTSIIVAILFSSSIIMCCLGVIGQYIYMTYITYQNKPLYNIKQEL